MAGRDPRQFNNPHDAIRAVQESPPPRTSDEVRNQLNLIEWAIGQIDPQTDYQAEILDTLHALLGTLKDIPGGGGGGGGVDRTNLPLGQYGLTLEPIVPNGDGLAVFDTVSGRLVAEVDPRDAIGTGEAVWVVDENNRVASTVDVGVYGGLSLNRSGIGGEFERDETQTNVTISPDETKTVLEVSVSRETDIISVGTNDETHSLYRYLRDGEPINSESLKSPLGLYNDPYEFPTPLRIQNSFEVRVKRESSAPGSADYFSKVTYYN